MMYIHYIYMLNKALVGWWSIYTLDGMYKNVKCMSTAQRYDYCTGM